MLVRPAVRCAVGGALASNGVIRTDDFFHLKWFVTKKIILPLLDCLYCYHASCGDHLCGYADHEQENINMPGVGHGSLEVGSGICNL